MGGGGRRLVYASMAVALFATPVAAGSVCVGDCDHDDRVRITELITGVGIALERSAVADCAAFDRDANERVTIDEILEGVGNAARGCSTRTARDPGTGPWELVREERVAEECGLDPQLLGEADEAIGQPWAVVRYGKLCHEFYPEGEDTSTHVFSATKTLGALVTGIAVFQTVDLPRTGRKTAPRTRQTPMLPTCAESRPVARASSHAERVPSRGWSGLQRGAVSSGAA